MKTTILAPEISGKFLIFKSLKSYTKGFRYGPIGEGLDEGHKNDQKAGARLL